MNAFSLCKKTVVVSLMALGLPLVGQAATQSGMETCTIRTDGVDEFLAAQGTQSTFFPPVPDYVGWAGGDFETFALVDYAGVADAYVQEQSGFGRWQPWTLISGSVLECPLPGGRAEIRVHLSSDNAMGFAQSIADLINNDFVFLYTSTTFGDKVQGTPGQWAFGSANLSTTFTISAAGAPLPDWYNVINETDPTTGKLTYGPVTLDIQSATQGPRSDPRCLRVHEVASTSANGKNLVFSTEIVEIDPAPCP